MKLTKAQRAFLSGIPPHVDYRTIGRSMRMAKTLEAAGYVEIVQIFAKITPAGRNALSEGEGE